MFTYFFQRVARKYLLDQVVHQLPTASLCIYRAGVSSHVFYEITPKFLKCWFPSFSFSIALVTEEPVESSETLKNVCDYRYPLMPLWNQELIVSQWTQHDLLLSYSASKLWLTVEGQSLLPQ